VTISPSMAVAVVVARLQLVARVIISACSGFSRARRVGLFNNGCSGHDAVATSDWYRTVAKSIGGIMNRDVSLCAVRIMQDSFGTCINTKYRPAP
jgi:hypothetical protein